MALRLVSAGAAQALVGAIASREGMEVQGAFGAVGAMIEKFRGPGACDVVILTHSQIAGLVAERRVVEGSASDLGTVATAIAVREGDAVPDVASEETLRAALLAADSVFFPDPSKATAGIHFAKVLERLGVHAALEKRLRTFPNGATTMRNMAQEPGHPIGCTQATEILATPGIRFVAPLPRGFELETIYTAAVSANAVNEAEARRFVAAISGVSSRELREQSGFGLSP